MTDSARERGLKAYQELFGEPKDMSHAGPLDELTVDHLFANVWTREGLSMRDRSLVTVALLAALGRDAELERHLQGAEHQKISTDEITELLIHVAHYAGWPAGHNALRILKARDLIDLNVRMGEAEKNRDNAFLATVLADDLVFRRANGQVIGKTTYLEDLLKPENTYESLVAEDVDASVLGTVALVSLRVLAKGQRGETRFAGTYRNVRLFRRDAHGWRCFVWFNTVEE